MFCKFCGTKIDENSIFCSSCGKNLTSTYADSSIKDSANQSNSQYEEEIIINKPEDNTVRPPKSVSFFNAIKNFYVNYTNFSGRAVRTEALYIYLYNLIITIVFSILSVPPAVAYAWSAIHLIPGIALNVRRLHDVGKSASYLWLLLIPIVGPFILFYFQCCDSDFDNQWGLSPYNTIPKNTNKKKFDGYSAITKNATHIWNCECGANISVSPCPFCGKEYIFTVNNEDDLKKSIINQIDDQFEPSPKKDFFNKFFNCIYSDRTPETITDLKFIIFNCQEYVDDNIMKIMLDVCNKKLESLNLKKCMGCGEFLPIDSKICDCGYKF